MGKGNPNPVNKWKPGQSGNPNGRPPKGQTLTDALREHIDKDEIAALLTELAKGGDIGALKYIYDRLDGKPTETVHNLMQNLPDVIEID